MVALRGRPVTFGAGTVNGGVLVDVVEDVGGVGVLVDGAVDVDVDRM
jgi:hypothetical protein